MLLQPGPAILPLELEKYNYKRVPKRGNLRDGNEWQTKRRLFSTRKKTKAERTRSNRGNEEGVKWDDGGWGGTCDLLANL